MDFLPGSLSPGGKDGMHRAMKRTTITTVLVALALIATGAGAAAAAGQNADAQTQTDGQAGPPSDLPGSVPDFVGDIHDLVTDHIEGLLPGSELGDGVSENASGNDATPTPS